MKKGWKIFWIVCGVTAAVGLICCVAAFAMGVTKEQIEAKYPYGIGWVSWDDDDDDIIDLDDDDTDLDDIDSDVVESGSGKSYSGIREIEGELAAGNIRFVQTDADEITVETKDVSKRLEFQSYQKEGTLYLMTQKNLTNLADLGDGTITIYLPKDLRLEEVSVELGAGMLNIDRICADSFSVDAGAGEVVVQKFDVTEAEFDCNAGSVTANGSAQRYLEIGCGIGEINLTVDGCEEDYDYEISCKVGEIVCGDRSYSGIGHKEYIDNKASKKMSLDCEIGQVNVQFTQAGEHYE